MNYSKTNLIYTELLDIVQFYSVGMSNGHGIEIRYISGAPYTFFFLDLKERNLCYNLLDQLIHNR